MPTHNPGLDENEFEQSVLGRSKSRPQTCEFRNRMLGCLKDDICQVFDNLGHHIRPIPSSPRNHLLLTTPSPPAPSDPSKFPPSSPDCSPPPPSAQIPHLLPSSPTSDATSSPQTSPPPIYSHSQLQRSSSAAPPTTRTAR